MSQYHRFRCSGCGYVYDEEQGEPHEGFAAGTPWTDVPEDWPCPDCAVREKPDFERLDPETGDTAADRAGQER